MASGRRPPCRRAAPPGQVLRVDPSGEEDDDEDGRQAQADDAEDMFHVSGSQAKRIDHCRASRVGALAASAVCRHLRSDTSPSRSPPTRTKLYIFTVCQQHRRKTAVDLARRGAAAESWRRAARRRAGAPCGRSSIAIPASRARATTMAGARSSRKPARSGSAPETTIIEERVKSVLSGNDSPDLTVRPLHQSLPGLRARLRLLLRPTHAQLPRHVAGTRLRDPDHRQGRTPPNGCARRSRSRAYGATSLNVGSATDAYQPVERKLGITRSVIEVLAECAHPFSLVTKSSGIERDLDLIAPMAERGLVASMSRSHRSIRRWRASSSRARRRRTGA